jgi:photosystem I protein PsaO
VFVLGFLGWTVPSTIGVSAFGGSSLFGLFTSSIGENMVRHATALSEPPNVRVCSRVRVAEQG